MLGRRGKGGGGWDEKEGKELGAENCPENHIRTILAGV